MSLHAQGARWSGWARGAGEALLPSPWQAFLGMFGLGLLQMEWFFVLDALRFKERPIFDGTWKEAKRELSEAVEQVAAWDMLKVLAGASALGAYGGMVLPSDKLSNMMGAIIIVLQQLHSWHGAVEAALERSRFEEEIKRLTAEIAKANQTGRPATAASRPMYNYNTRRSARSTLRANRERLEEAYSPVSRDHTSAAASRRAASADDSTRDNSPSASPPPSRSNAS